MEHGAIGSARPSRRSATRWRLSKSVLRRRLYAALVVLDASIIVLAFLAAGWVRFDHPFDPRSIFLIGTVLPVYAVSAVATRAYSTGVLLDRWSSVGRSLQALATSAALLLFLLFNLRAGAEVSRLVLALGEGTAAIGLTGARLLFGRNAKTLLGGSPYDVVVIGDGTETMPTGDCVLFVDASDVIDPTQHDPMLYDRFARTIGDVDRVVVSCPPERRAMWAAALKGANVQAEVIAPEFIGVDPIGLSSYMAMPTLIVARGPLGIRDRAIKRLFDVSIAATALLLLAPVMIAVAIAVRLSGSGPILFTQMRIGRQNRLFRMFKFRSMRVDDADAHGARSTSRDDDRITAVGRFIRASSLDELPQLLNVLRGDMSIVGPRPHALGSTAEDQLFWEVDERYWHRHACKPGLTGLAQVRGYRGATLLREDLTNRLGSDLEYVNDWTIWRDCVILVRTVAVLFHRNAF